MSQENFNKPATSAVDKVRAAIGKTVEEKRSAAEIVRDEIETRKTTTEEERKRVEAEEVAAQEAIEAEHSIATEEKAVVAREVWDIDQKLTELKGKRANIKGNVRTAIAEVKTYADAKPEEAADLIDKTLGKKKRKETFASELAESASVRADAVPLREKKASLKEKKASVEARIAELTPKTREGKKAQNSEILYEVSKSYNFPHGVSSPFGSERMGALLGSTLSKSFGGEFRDDGGALFQGILFKNESFIDKRYGEGALKRAMVAGVLDSNLPAIRTKEGGYNNRVPIKDAEALPKDALRPVIEARYDLEKEFFDLKDTLIKEVPALGYQESPELGLKTLEKEIERLRVLNIDLTYSSTRQSLDPSGQTQAPVGAIRADLMPDTNEIYTKKERIKSEIETLSTKIRIKGITLKTESTKTPMIFGKEKHKQFLRDLVAEIGTLNSQEAEARREVSTLEKQYNELSVVGDKVSNRAKGLGLLPFMKEGGYASVEEYMADVDQAVEEKEKEIKDRTTKLQTARDQLDASLNKFKKVQEETSKKIPADIARGLGGRA